MHEWTKILAQPIGLAGFVLFLVFGLFAKIKQRDERRWLFLSAIIMALIALIGGLSIAYFQMQTRNAVDAKPQPSPASPSSQQQINQIHQVSNGAGSPNVQGVQGDVTITIDQSSGNAIKPETRLSPQKRRSQKKTQ